ncbi:MAG TPA: nucleoside recognition domain-containing protein [Fibrobacteria bacterium]|nr:nucleoside recognition domain-containing protein [Fibrobacteria bacterium]
MILNVVWLGLFFVGGLFGLWKFVVSGDASIFPAMAQATFDGAKGGFEIALGLTGALTLWMGLLKVGEEAGAIRILSRLLGPLLRRVFPGLPTDHPASGNMVMNFAANMLGLDNAATPAGLRAMKELETLNPNPGTATDHQAMFMVLHAASLTLFPVSIMAIRAANGAKNPADIFLPILVASAFSVLGGFLSAALVQRIKLRDPVLLAWILGVSGTLAAMVTAIRFPIADVWNWCVSLGATALEPRPHAQVEAISTALGTGLMIAAILVFLGLASIRRINAWEVFTEGAKEGFTTAVSLIPFMVGVLVAVGVFRASGGMQMLVDGIWICIAWTGLPQETVGAIPTMIMKPLSGGAARGLTVDAMRTFGPDSFTGRLASLLQGSTDTTLYVIALYSGAINLKRIRHVLPCALVADLCGFAGAFAMAMIFFR